MKLLKFIYFIFLSLLKLFCFLASNCYNMCERIYQFCLIHEKKGGDNNG